MEPWYKIVNPRKEVSALGECGTSICECGTSICK